jgi:UDP-glucose 4-epimerase
VPSAPPDSPGRRTCLVTGATGALGPAVVSALLAEGWAVRALVRHEPPANLLPAVVDVRRGDITIAPDVAGAMAGIDRVFHLAALLHIVNPSPELRSEYARVNVEGTRAVADAAARAGVGRVVFFSTIAVYGPATGALLDEQSPTLPDTMYGETKRVAEDVITAARDRAGRPIGTVLRLAAVYGPGVKGNYRRLLDALARRRFIPVGPGRNRRTLIFEEDAARAALLAADRDEAAGEIFNVTDGRIHEVREIVDAICAALGRRSPRLVLPIGPARAAAWAVDRVRGRGAALAALDKYIEDVAVDGSKLHRRIGFTPACDLQAGWRRTVEVLRERGEL